jgi:hypothetical protein
MLEVDEKGNPVLGNPRSTFTGQKPGGGFRHLRVLIRASRMASNSPFATENEMGKPTAEW